MFIGPQNNFVKKNKAVLKKTQSNKIIKVDHQARIEELKKFKAERKAKLNKKSHSV